MEKHKNYITSLIVILTLVGLLFAFNFVKAKTISYDTHYQNKNDSSFKSLDFLKKFNTKYPSKVNLFNNEILTGRLKKLLQNRYYFLKKTWEVESPITIKNNFFIATGAQAHNAGATNFIIVVDFLKNNIYVGVREEYEEKDYSEDGSISEELQNWSKLMKDNSAHFRNSTTN